MGRLLTRFGDAAVERQFTDRERAEAPSAGPRRAAYFAARFAAKEAVMKALGIGFARGVAFADVEVTLPHGGAPLVVLRGEAATVAARLGIRGWMLSISRGGGVAVASAIAVDAETPVVRPYPG